MRKKRQFARTGRRGTLLFIIPAVAMLIVGFGLLFDAALGPRLHSDQGIAIPAGVATAGLGAALLTRSAIAVFFLFISAAAAVALCAHDLGFLHPITLSILALLPFCALLVKHAD